MERVEHFEEESASDSALDRLAALVKSGTSFAAAAQRMAAAPEVRAETLRGVSFLRVFDRELAKAALATTTNEEFDSLINQPGIEPYDLERGMYRVKDSVAVQHLEGWLNDLRSDSQRKPIRELCSRAYEPMLARTEYSAIEKLRLRLAVERDADAGLEEFNWLFAAADQAFDLGTCHALVQTLRELDNFQAGGRNAALKLLSEKQRRRCDELIPYVAARGRFIDEYAKSANYLQREALKTLTNNFLNTGGDWLLPIFGTGGRGKTMYLHWLIARRSVPGRIPVARVDFDDLNIAKLGKHPSLVLLRFAEQLDRQSSEAPFSELLQSYGKYTAILSPPSRLPKGVNLGTLEDELSAPNSSIEADIESRFAFKAGTRLTVLILDTVEEGVLHFPDALRHVIELLRRIRGDETSPSGLKVILSGRYDLKAKGFLKEGDPKPVDIQPFTDDESDAYLVKYRKVEDEELRPHIVRKARGNPFVLSLIADLVISRDIQDAKGIDELQPEFAYLIRRIIDRIPDAQFGVRWVVRYGVIPRRLTQEFFDAVMAPVLQDEVAAAGRFDRVTDYNESFPRGTVVNAGVLWNDLQRYAADNGWLRGTKEELRFQPEVVKPMRALLAKEAIHYVLHRKAHDWFEKRADEADTVEAWAAWKAEQIYHRCWLRASEVDDPLVPTSARAGEDYFGALLSTCLADPRASSGAVRRTLLASVTGFVETDRDEEAPGGAAITARIEPRVASVITPHIVGWDFLEWAKSAAGIGFGPCRLEENSTTNIRNALALARLFESPEEWPAATAALIEMALAVSERSYTKALELARDESHQGRTEPAEMYSYALLMARALAGTENDLAEAQYESAYSILRAHRLAAARSDDGRKESVQVASAEYQPGQVLAEAGQELAKMRRLDRALIAYGRAEIPESDPLMLDVAELHIETGAYEVALAAVNGLPATLTPERIRRVRAWAGAMLGRLDPAPTSVNLSKDAAAIEASAVVDGAWYTVRSAAQRLEELVRQYRTMGDARRADFALLWLARMLVDQAGDWLGAERALTRSPLRTPALELELLHIRFQRGMDPGPASSGFGKLYLRMQDQSDCRPELMEFIELLRSVQPEWARYEYLRPFRWMPGFDGVEDLAEKFEELAPRPDPGTPDFLARVFDYVELLRCLKPHVAKELLAAAASDAAPGTFVLHRIVDAARRLESQLPSAERVIDFAKQCESRPLGVATLISFAAASIERGDQQAASATMAAIQMPLPSELLDTVMEAEHHANLAALNTRDINRGEVNSAVKILNALGQENRALRLAARMSAGGTVVPKAVSKDVNRAVIRLNTVPDPWNVPPFANAYLEHAKALLGSQDVPRTLRLALGDTLRPKPTIELVIDDALSVVALPWEWAFRESALCFRSSERLEHEPPFIFANVWPKLPLLLRRLLSAIRPVRVLILKQAVAVQERAGRGFDIASRRTLSTIYETQGARVFEPEYMQQAAITNIVRSHTPNLLHIQAPVIETEGLLALDLAVEGSDSTRLFTAEYLKTLLAEGRAMKPPLIILDPPRPPDEAEVARQLLLRNRFAADFVALGKARAVFCTGLFDRSLIQLAAERLAMELSLTPRLTQLLSVCRNELSGDRFSGAGAALFAADPAELLR